MHSSGVPLKFNWDEYLNLAYELAGHSPPQPSNMEAKLRVSMSRAYYAVFCKARNHLRDVDGDTSIPKTGRAHTDVIEKFRKSHDKTQQKIAHALKRLRIDRNNVDYEDFVAGLPSLAVADLELARRSLSRLSSL